MSNEALTWAFKQDLPMTEKFVLVSLADYADDEHSCYPSYNKTAKRVGCSRRTAMRAVESLADAGFIRSVPRGRANGSASSNRYVLNVGGSDRESLPLVTESHHPSDTQTLGVVTRRHQGSDTSVTPLTINEPSPLTPTDTSTRTEAAQVRKSPYSKAFLEWWDHYPRKVDKGRAWKAWKNIPDRDQDTLVQGATRYANDPNREARYTKHPATWLNARAWEDEEQLPARGPEKPGANDRMRAGQELAARLRGVTGDQHAIGTG